MSHNWKEQFAKPFHFSQSESNRREFFAPWCQEVTGRPGEFRTCAGGIRAMLVVDGQHLDTVTDGPVRDEKHKKVSAATIDKVVSSLPIQGDVLCYVDFSELRSLVPAQVPYSPPKVVKAKCEECGGTGKIECYACGHEHGCNDCDGSGSVIETEYEDVPFFNVFIKGRPIDSLLLAPFLDMIPQSGLIAIRQAKASMPVTLSGDGWVIIVMPATVSDTFPVPFKECPITVSPNAPATA